jgi:phosphoribosylaminoimidazole (AIR) synthetase
VALGGTLTLATGTTLAFNFTEKDAAPVLNGTAVTVSSGSVNVKVSSTGDFRPKGGDYALTSGMDFSGKAVNLVDPPEWTRGAKVVDGDIVVSVKSQGFMLIVQ